MSKTNKPCGFRANRYTNKTSVGGQRHPTPLLSLPFIVVHHHSWSGCDADDYDDDDDQRPTGNSFINNGEFFFESWRFHFSCPSRLVVLGKMGSSHSRDTGTYAVGGKSECRLSFLFCNLWFVLRFGTKLQKKSSSLRKCSLWQERRRSHLVGFKMVKYEA